MSGNLAFMLRQHTVEYLYVEDLLKLSPILCRDDKNSVGVALLPGFSSVLPFFPIGVLRNSKHGKLAGNRSSLIILTLREWLWATVASIVISI